MGITFGAAFDDGLDSDGTLAAPTVFTASFWANVEGNGGNSQGRVLEWNSAAVIMVLFYDGLSANKYRLQRFSSGTTGDWEWGVGGVDPLNAGWHHIMVTQSDTSDALVWVDGVSESVTTTASLTGTPNTTASTWVIGNRPLHSRQFDGDIAEFALWKTALGADEASTLANGAVPTLVNTQDLLIYAPLLNSTDDTEVVNNAATIDGTLTTSEHPLMLRNRVNITPNQATANHTTRSRPVFISHEDLGSPAAGDMMRLRVLRDYDHVANTDDLQLHNVALWQKDADTA